MFQTNNKSFLLRVIFFTGLLFSLLSPVSHANTVYQTHTQLTLKPATLTLEDSFWVSLNLKIDDHWHVYWKNPGDSGFPVEVLWDLPDGYQAGDIQWPYPIRMDEAGLATYGYDGEVDLLIPITRVGNAPSDEPLTFRAQVNWLACEKVCVPGTANLFFSLPLEDALFYLTDDELAKAQLQLPLKESSWTFRAEQNDQAFLLYLTPSQENLKNLKDVQFFSHRQKIIDHAAEQDLKEVTQGGYRLVIPKSDLLEGEVKTLSGVLVSQTPWESSSDHQAIEINEDVSESLNSFVFHFNIQAALIFAFLGGLILNLMPCVLPVLSIKVLNLVSQASQEKGKVLQHGLMFTFGVVSCFWVLAGSLIFLRVMGLQVGWGFQFQSPLFLIFMIGLFFILALSLFGVFEIGASLTRLQTRKEHQGSLKGSYLNGVLATVVATPCTAPFMGTALGFAMTQPILISMGIFTCLGLGMAFPYLILSLFPGLLKFLPKPGAWMNTLKKFFGVLMLATVVWLIWVLAQQRGMNAVYAVGVGLCFVFVGVFVLGRWGNLAVSARERFNAIGIALTLFVIGFFLSIIVSYNQPMVSSVSDGSISEQFVWHNFSKEYVEQLRENGDPIFIDFTASWCLTCQVNKKTSLTKSEVIEAFKDRGIIPVKADWTNYDAEITEALAAFGKTSVPFYVFYPAGKNSNPVFLPELLTPGIVLEKINQGG